MLVSDIYTVVLEHPITEHIVIANNLHRKFEGVLRLWPDAQWMAASIGCPACLFYLVNAGVSARAIFRLLL